jgi:sugar lactone lactonase YvrE
MQEQRKKSIMPATIRHGIAFRSNSKFSRPVEVFQLRSVSFWMASFLGWLTLAGMPAGAQTSAPIVLPNTFSTVAGSTTGSAGVTGFTAGAACSVGSPYKATDVYGDGCLATQAVFGPDFQDGIRVDPQGNIWIADIDNNWTGTQVTLLRKVDAKSGIVSLVSSSANSNCTLATATTAGANDSQGDGCPFANSRAPKERGWGMDPYGNLLTGSYGSGEVHLYCNAVSPLCPIAAGVTQTYGSAQKQVGNVYRIAGCVGGGTTATGSATSLTAPGASDGYFATSYWNLPGDVAAWGPSNSSFNATATGTGSAGTGVCGALTTGEINGVRGVVGDQYGNVYLSDGSNLRMRVVVGPPNYTLPNGTVLTNPLPAVIALYPTYSGVTAAQMYGRIYPILGGFPATTAGSACPAGTGTAADVYGDSCPWYNTSETSVNPIGLTIDTTVEGGITAANPLFIDGTSGNLRVLYLGPTVAAGNVTAASYPMANAVVANNPTVSSITHGYVYLLAGNSTGAIGPAPTLGTATSLSGYKRLAAGPNGNVYLGQSNSSPNIAFYDLSTGYVRILLQSSGGVTVTNPVVGGSALSTTVCSVPGTGDGLPAFATVGAYSNAALTTNACFNYAGTGSTTQSLAVDAFNNLYLGDVELDTSGYGRSRVREVLAAQLFPTAIGTPSTQVLRIHGPANTTASTTAIAAASYDAASSEIGVSTPACGATADGGNTVDCLATVTFSPAAPGLRAATVGFTDASLSTGSAYAISGTSTGSALVADPSGSFAPATANIGGTHLTPVGVAVDSNGDVFTMDQTAGKFTEISGSTITQLAGTLPSSPTQIALDPAGNVYAAGSGASTIVRLALGAGGTYTAGSVSITGIATPQAVAFDLAGNLYVADKTTASVYKVAAGTVSGTALPGYTGVLPSYTPLTTVATGLTSPTGLAIDGYGNLYICDPGSGSILRVDAKMTTLLAGIHPVSIAIDAAADVYYQDSTADAIVEIPYNSISNGVAGTTAVTILSALKTPAGLAVAGNGIAYSADSGAKTLVSVARNAYSYNFGVGSSGSPTLTGTITNIGNQASTGSNPNTNTTNFSLGGGPTNGCPVVAGILAAQQAGSACTFTASFVGLGTSTVSEVVSYLPAGTTTGSLTLTGTLNSISGTTTTLAAQSGPTVLPGVTVNLSATVASTAAVAGQTVTFLNGASTLGTGTTNSAGVATFSFTAGAIGTTYTLKATFAGTPTLGPSSSTTQSLTVALTPTTLTLALSTTSTYPGAPVTFTATQTPAAAGETLSFLSGTTVLGTGVISATGVATYTYTPTTGGTYSITASFPSDGKVYAASVSSVQMLTVSAAAALLTASPNTITIAPGGTAAITLTLTPGGGYSGLATLSCTSPVAYINCITSFPMLPVGTTANNSIYGTITVAPTTSSLVRSGEYRGLAFAILAPLSLLGLLGRFRNARYRLPRVLLLVAVGVMASYGFSGCSKSSSGTSGTPPSGSQVITFTATAAGVSQSATVTVTIN